MKLSEEAPTQHIAIMGLAAAFIFLSLLQGSSTPGSEQDGPEEQEVNYAENGQEILYGNPKMSWYQKIFCRGFQRSSSCSYELLHPLKPYLQAEGAEIIEGAPEQKTAIRYRGSLPQNKAINGHIVLDGLYDPPHPGQ